MTGSAAATPPAHGLEDAFGRRLHHLRLSVTDRCNFRCVYCAPPPPRAVRVDATPRVDRRVRP